MFILEIIKSKIKNKNYKSKLEIKNKIKNKKL